jgi:GNAT superfamily N-acetyltransferase
MPTGPTGDAEIVELREVRTQSAEALEALELYFAELDDRFPEGIDAQAATAHLPTILDPPRGRFYLATEAGDVVGCGGLTFLDDGTAELRRMWVRPDARGRGVGRALLERLEHEAWRRGCVAIVLDTHSSLREAVALYRSAGYREVAPYNDNPDAQFWFRKDAPAAAPPG